jgi:DNA polymerase III, epsilon subunit and related 3''-5'' exonucleases
MKLVVVDTETTGLEKTDQVVELAIVSLIVHPKRAFEVKSYSTLVKPTCPVSSGARAVHHISDEELADAPTMERLLELYELVGGGMTEFQDADIIAGHFLEFDLRMLRQSGVPDSILPAKKLCTLACARHLWPDAPKHSNQFLRYHLGLDVPSIDGKEGLPHRALPDATVTTWMLLEMLKTHELDDLVALSSKQVLLKNVTRGSYAGRTWESMDIGYLRWVLKKNFSDVERYAAQYWLDKKTGNGRKVS